MRAELDPSSAQIVDCFPAHQRVSKTIFPSAVLSYRIHDQKNRRGKLILPENRIRLVIKVLIPIIEGKHDRLSPVSTASPWGREGLSERQATIPGPIEVTHVRRKKVGWHSISRISLGLGGITYLMIAKNGQENHGIGGSTLNSM